MDAAEVAEMVRDLKISKEAEGDGITITKEEERRANERLAKTVVGKIFARRPVNKEILKTHLPRILRARGGMETEMIGHNIFVISFALATNKRVALEDEPWHFFQDLMIIKETNRMQSVAEVEFWDITIWIQCHNVPMACLETKILKKIGGRVGTVEEIDMDEGGIRLGRTVRMLVSRKLDTPLLRCVPVKNETGDGDSIVIIQYEKLPHFCFACGRIGHILKDCEDGTTDKKVLRFDQRLRVGLNSFSQAQRIGAGGSGWRGSDYKGREETSKSMELVRGAREEGVIEISGGGERGKEIIVQEVAAKEGGRILEKKKARRRWSWRGVWTRMTWRCSVRREEVVRF